MAKSLHSTLCGLFGVVFILVGVLGFVSNPIVGEGAIFHTNLNHDLVHLVTGIVALAMAKSHSSAVWFLRVFGVVYLAVAVLGLMHHHGDGATALLGLVEVNHADNWLHVVLGVVILGAGLMPAKNRG